MKNTKKLILLLIICFLLLLVKNVYAVTQEWQSHFDDLFNGQDVSFKCVYKVNGVNNLNKITITGSKGSGIEVTHNEETSVPVEFDQNKYKPKWINNVEYADNFNFDDLMLFIDQNFRCYDELYLKKVNDLDQYVMFTNKSYDNTNPYWVTINAIHDDNSYIVDGQESYGLSFEGEPVQQGTGLDKEEPDDNVVDVMVTIEDIVNDGVLEGNLIYGNVLRCQRFGTQSDRDHILQMLDKTKVNFSDGKSVSFCLEKYEMTLEQYESQNKESLYNFIYNQFNQLSTKASCPAGYSITGYFKKPLFQKSKDDKKAILYYGTYCAYSENDSSIGEYERLLEDMKQYIYVFDTWQYSKCYHYHADCKNYLNESKINKYNYDFRQLKELIIANEDETYDFSLGETYLAKINSMKCATELDSDCSALETGKIFTPTPTEASCSSLFGDPNQKNDPAYYLSFAFKIIRYLAIVLLIVFSSMDLISAVASHEDEQLKKAINKLIIRFIYCIVIFLLPELITFILKYLNERAVDLCINTEM